MNVAAGKQYRKITVQKMRTNPAKLANLPPHVLQHIGYRFHDLVVNCEYGESDMLCNESNTTLFTNKEMLNCYTLKLIQGEISQTGPDDGLSLLLYIGKKDVLNSLGIIITSNHYDIIITSNHYDIIITSNCRQIWRPD